MDVMYPQLGAIEVSCTLRAYGGIAWQRKTQFCTCPGYYIRSPHLNSCHQLRHCRVADSYYAIKETEVPRGNNSRGKCVPDAARQHVGNETASIISDGNKRV